MLVQRYKFTPKQYMYKNSNEYGEFSYYWAFCPYESGDGFAKITLNIDQEGYTDESIANFTSYADYPELATILESIVKLYNGCIITRNPASFGFIFSEKQTMFDFISYVGQKMNECGIGPFNGIDRCSAFPSVEYATDMFTYLFDEDCSLIEIEDHMKNSANIYGNYDEICGFKELPCTSEQKFNVLKSTDVSEFLKEWDIYLKKFIKDHEGSPLPTKLRSELKKVQANNSPDIPTQISEEYQSFSSMWL